MLLTVNGEGTLVPDGCTVAGLLELQGLSNRPCAVEVNREVVPRREHSSRNVTAGDVIEIVTLVGGG